MGEQALPARFFLSLCESLFCYFVACVGCLQSMVLSVVFNFFSKINRKIFGGYKKKRYFCIAIKDCALIGRLAQLV